MKKVLVALILLCAGYWVAMNKLKLAAWWESAQASAVDRFQEPTEPKVSKIEKKEEPPTKLAPAPPPPPAPKAPPEPPPPPLPKLDPGVFYTRERITQVTDAGIVAIPERTRVIQVGEKDDLLVIEADGNRLSAHRSKLTNDPAEVAVILQQIQAAAITSTGIIPPSALATPSDPKAAKEANAARRRVLKTHISEIDRKITDLNRRVKELRSAAASAKGRGDSSGTNQKTISDLETEIRQLEAHRLKLKLEEAAIPP